MKWKRFLYRKLPYLAAIVLLLVPISWLSMPRSGKPNAPGYSPGGQLAQLRSEREAPDKQVKNLTEERPGTNAYSRFTRSLVRQVTTRRVGGDRALLCLLAGETIRRGSPTPR